MATKCRHGYVCSIFVIDATLNHEVHKVISTLCQCHMETDRDSLLDTLRLYVPSHGHMLCKTGPTLSKKKADQSLQYRKKRAEGKKVNENCMFAGMPRK